MEKVRRPFVEPGDLDLNPQYINALLSHAEGVRNFAAHREQMQNAGGNGRIAFGFDSEDVAVAGWVRHGSE